MAQESKHGALVTELENQYTRGTGQYPNDQTAVYNMLLNYMPQTERGYNCCRNPRNSVIEALGEENAQTEMLFLQSNAPIPGTDGIVHDHTQFYACQKKGHYSGKYPDESGIEREVINVQVEEELPDEEEYVSNFVFPKNDTRFDHIMST